MSAPTDRAGVVRVIGLALCRADHCHHASECRAANNCIHRAELSEDAGKHILAALEAAGLRVVPVEATEEMGDAGWIDKDDVSPAEIWAAMLAASPFAPPKETQE